MRFCANLTRRFTSLPLACLAAIALSGCGSSPTRLEANLIASKDANQDDFGRSLPIVIRVYELKTTGSFQAADFFSIYDREADTLGGDLLAREELQLRPEEEKQIVRDLSPEAQHLGVVGAFQQIDGATWRATQALTPGETNKVQISVGSKAISIR